MPVVVLPWLPIMALLVFFTIPRREELICDSEGCVLEIAKGIRTRSRTVNDVRIETDADTKRPVLVVETVGGTVTSIERFDPVEGKPALDAYARYRETRTPARVVLLGPQWWRLFLALVGAELGLLAYFAIVQRRR